MAYINPLEILDLQGIPESKIDNTLIKKAKRRLFADIDLSDDGLLEYKGARLSKSDCEKAIDELENKSIRDFYSILCENSLLNNYLANGDEAFFRRYRTESIYSHQPFIDFISPYFAHRLNKSLTSAFKSRDEDHFKSILRTIHLVIPKDYNIAYKSLSFEIQNRIQSLSTLTREIREEETDFDEFDLAEIVDNLKEDHSPSFLNDLPPYFQSQLNSIGKELNFLQLAIDNSYGETTLCVDILEHLFKLRLESATMETFRNNHKILRARLMREHEIALHRPILQKWAKELVDLRKMNEHVENSKMKPHEAYKIVSTQIDFNNLNSLGAFANDIKAQVAIALRNISVASWNNHQDINSAVSFIDKALTILDIPSEVKDSLTDDRENLYKIRTDNAHLLICHYCKKNQPAAASKVSVKMYKVYNRSNLGRQRNVQFHTTTVDIPRCEECTKFSGKSLVNSVKIILSCIATGIVIGALMEGAHFILGGLLGLLVGSIVRIIYKNRFYKMNGLQRVNDNDFKSIKDNKREGWKLSEPTA